MVKENNVCCKNKDQKYFITNLTIEIYRGVIYR
jgi:hypothetical protein